MWRSFHVRRLEDSVIDNYSFKKTDMIVTLTFSHEQFVASPSLVLITIYHYISEYSYNVTWHAHSCSQHHSAASITILPCVTHLQCHIALTSLPNPCIFQATWRDGRGYRSLEKADHIALPPGSPLRHFHQHCFINVYPTWSMAP